MCVLLLYNRRHCHRLLDYPGRHRQWICSVGWVFAIFRYCAMRTYGIVSNANTAHICTYQQTSKANERTNKNVCTKRLNDYNRDIYAKKLRRIPFTHFRAWLFFFFNRSFVQRISCLLNRFNKIIIIIIIFNKRIYEYLWCTQSPLPPSLPPSFSLSLSCSSPLVWWDEKQIIW